MKKIFIFTIILICLFNVWALTVFAEESSFSKGLKTTAGNEGAGYQAMPSGPGGYISKLLGSALAPYFIGVMGLLLLCYGGFIWMMSRGREQEVERARAIITNTLIAMLIVYSAWAIVKLIIPIWELAT